jgi:DNA-binding CsgD family transcriptional regulator
MSGTSTQVEPRSQVDSWNLIGAVTEIKALEPVEVAFAAKLDRENQQFVLGDFQGAQTEHLQGLVSPLDAGLGGRCITLRRPVFVADYVMARGITHQHDRPVTQEGLRAVFAIPVHGKDGVTGVVYGAARRPLTFGDKLLNAAVNTVQRMTTPPGPERLGSLDDAALVSLGPGTEPIPGQPVWTREDIQELHAELRAIAGGVGDMTLRKRLQQLSDRLSLKANSGSPPQECPVELSPREIDVLTEVAVGCANAQVAERLGLTLETTKSYLKSAMYKLDSHNRMEAVHRARRSGLLP